MIRKMLGAAVVVAAMTAMAMPAGAANAPRTASLTDGGSATEQGTASLKYVSANGRWEGNVHVKAGALAPGKYVYTVIMGVDTDHDGDIDTYAGDSICQLTVRKHGKASCHGRSKNLGVGGEWGVTNSAEIYPSFGGYPLLSGDLH